MLSRIPALFLFDRLGRRNLLFFCGLGMVVVHLVAVTVFITDCNVVKSIINGTTINQEIVKCERSYGILMLVFTAIFVAGFAVSWGPVCWIYAAEIYPLNIRARAMSFTTGINCFTAMMMSYMLELIAPLGIHGVFYLFSGLCFLAVIFVYLFCPETKGILLEDIEAVFDNFQVKNRTILRMLREPCQRNIIKTYT